jgi:N-acetyl sugar amidotransferase
MTEEYGMYGLPTDVKFCKKCTMNNQRPSSTIEFKNKPGQKKRTIAFDENGVCEACRYAEKKKEIDWEKRERELQDLCDRFRRNDGSFDVVVPGSGGKDSVMAAHILKHKYDMHPILVTWPPHIYTRVGRRNFESWLNSGFANYTYWPNQKVHRKLTRFAFENLVHPFQPFMIGQKNLAPRLSVQLGIPLVVYGENEAEYGNPIADNLKSTRDPSFYSRDCDLDEIYLGGVCAKDLIKEHGMSIADLDAYLPESAANLDRIGTEVHYLGYYIRWHPQEAYYYAVEHSDFLPNDFRTEGSYSKYNSIDDKIDWLHYYTTYIKFGIGRATYDSAQEIRNGDITRDEGIRLIRRFDGEFPEMYLHECLEYMGIRREQFNEIIDKARPPHLWKENNGEWTLMHTIWDENTLDY